MSALKTIEEQWQGFAAMVFRGMTPAAGQREEMKKAFFAGAWSLFCAVEQIGTPEVSELEGHVFLETWRLECLAFKKKIIDEYSETN